MPACHARAGPWHARFLATSLSAWSCCGVGFRLRATKRGDSGPDRSDRIGTTSTAERSSRVPPFRGDWMPRQRTRRALPHDRAGSNPAARWASLLAVGLLVGGDLEDDLEAEVLLGDAVEGLE